MIIVPSERLPGTPRCFIDAMLHPCCTTAHCQQLIQSLKWRNAKHGPDKTTSLAQQGITRKQERRHGLQSRVIPVKVWPCALLFHFLFSVFLLL